MPSGVGVDELVADAALDRGTQDLDLLLPGLGGHPLAHGPDLDLRGVQRGDDPVAEGGAHVAGVPAVGLHGLRRSISLGGKVAVQQRVHRDRVAADAARLRVLHLGRVIEVRLGLLGLAVGQLVGLRLAGRGVDLRTAPPPLPTGQVLAALLGDLGLGQPLPEVVD